MPCWLLGAAPPAQPQPPAGLFGGEGVRVAPPWHGWPARSEPASSGSGWQSSRRCWVMPAPLGAIKEKKKSIYWDFCYHEGTNNPLPHPSCGLPSRPVPAPAAAATLTGVGQEFNGISRGRCGGRAGSRASRGSPPQPASKPACGWSVPSRCSSSSRPSTPKQPQHPEPAPRQGGPDGIQLFQWLRGGGTLAPPPKSQPARGVSEGGLDSPRGAN